MNKVVLKSVLLSITVLFAFSAFAQEEKEDLKKEVKKEVVVKVDSKENSQVTLKVLKDGDVVVDTTFTAEGEISQAKIDKILKKFEGDEVMINVESAAKKGKKAKVMTWVGTDGEVITEDIIGDLDSDEDVFFFKSDGNGDVKKFKTKEGNVLICKGDGGNWTVKRGDNIAIHGGDIKWDSKEGGRVIISKKGEGDEVEIITDDIIGKFHKGGDVQFFNKEDLDEHAQVWIESDEEGNEHAHGIFEDHEFDGGGHGDMVFFGEKRQGQTQLNPREDGTYRLSFESDELGPIVVEVFTGDGKRLFKQKVKHFYGRYLKDIDISDNETALYTVKVTQGENEIISEFEFK